MDDDSLTNFSSDQDCDTCGDPSSEMIYGYYLTRKAPAPGAQPPDAVHSVIFQYQTYQDDIAHSAFGWVGYYRALTGEEIKRYEMIPDAETGHLYPQYGIECTVVRFSPSGKKKFKRTWIKNEDKSIFSTHSIYKAAAVANELAQNETDEKRIARYFVRPLASAENRLPRA